MNFLSHYYFTQHTNDPYYTLGSILPDLLRNHGGTWRITPEKKRNEFSQSSSLLSLLNGWELHVEVDRIFHSSPVFLAETAALRKQLAPVFTRLPIRPFFLAHVGYELILDSLLLQEHSIKTVDFYQDLAACDPIIVQDFLFRSGILETASFSTFLKSFIQSRYLESYSETEKIVYALDQIGRRVWTEKFNEQEISEAIRVLDCFKNRLRPTFMGVFDEIDDTIR